jgi:hypothetical protein
MYSDFLIAVKNDNWDGIVKNLFTEENPYQQACLERDSKAVEKCLKKGWFVDNKHFWNQREMKCDCILSGCPSEFRNCPLYYLLFKKNNHQINDQDANIIFYLITYGLLSIEDIDDELIYNIFRQSSSTDQKIFDFLMSVIPVSRLASIRSIRSKETTILHAVLYSCRPLEQETKILKFLLSKPEMRVLAHKKDSYGESILREAVIHLNVEIVELLLSIEGYDVNEVSGYEKNCAIHVCLEKYAKSKDPCIWKKVSDIFELFMVHGFDLKITNMYGYSVESIIVDCGWGEILKEWDLPVVKHEKFTEDEFQWDVCEMVPNEPQKTKILEIFNLVEPYKYCKNVEKIEEIVNEIRYMMMNEADNFIEYVYRFCFVATHQFFQHPLLEKFFRPNPYY